MDIKVNKVTKQFGDNGLQEVDFNINEGDYICITGESGCGKSTLLNIISGMLKPDSGEIIIDGKNIFNELKESTRTKLRSSVLGYMTQSASLIPDLTIWQNIICPIELQGTKVNENKVNEIFEQLGIENIKASYPGQISGGEYRRALLARVLVLDTEVFLVDEPTSNLDEKSAIIVRDTLNKLHKENNKTLVVVTHDKEFLRYTDNIVNLAH